MGFAYCEVCRTQVPVESYESHLLGKKHRLHEDQEASKKKIEETGLIIRDVPLGVSAVEVQEAFGQFGTISKVEIYGRTAYLSFAEKSSCDEAVKHQHVIIRDQPLKVERRQIPNYSQATSDEKLRKRRHDGTQKTSGLKGAATGSKAGMKPPGTEGIPKIDNKQIMAGLAGIKSASVMQQMDKLKELLLAGKHRCDQVIQQICCDLVRAMKYTFEICQLFAFGSMTTGLAFKDSDLDIFCHLELNTKTHLLNDGKKSKSKKIFDKAKTCLYKGGGSFTNIVPIQRAKVPIIKFKHLKTNISCDLSFKDSIGYCNSNLLRHYLNMNERFFELVFFIKYWARVHDISNSNKFSNFSLCMLCLSFLLSLKNEDDSKVVPCVQDLMSSADPDNPHFYVSGWKCGFNTDSISINLPDSPNFSLLGLMKNFFEYITLIPFDTHVISVSTGEFISKSTFESPNELPEVYECYKAHILAHPDQALKLHHCAVIHDPFKLNHNLVERVDHDTMQHFTLLCKVSAEKCFAAMSCSEKQSTLFQSLLDPSIMVNQKICVSEAAPCPTKQVQGVSVIVITEPRLRRVASVDNLLSKIFARILHFTVHVSKVEDSDEGSIKVPKLEGEITHESKQCTVMVCKGHTDVWNGRKKAKQALNRNLRPVLSDPLSFNDELIISDYLSKQNVYESVVSFRCEVVNEKGRLYLNFFDTVSKKSGVFNALMTYLKTTLPKWIHEFSAMEVSSKDSQGSSLP